MSSKSLAPSDTMVLFAERVNAIMAQRRITQTELARRCGMSQSALSQKLTGSAGSCSFATADKIAAGLGTTTAEILAG